MPSEVIMPKVDMDMTSGRIVAWHVTEGAAVTRGAPLFDIETDKAAMEVESPADGVLHHIRPVGDDVPIGQPVGWIYAQGEAVGDAPKVDLPALESRPSLAENKPHREAPDMVQKVRATPRARKLARESGIDLADIAGTAVRGRVGQSDVSAALEPPEAAVDALSVIRTGDGTGMPLVLIHGFAGDVSAWAGVLAALPGGRPVYRIELPVHGKSPLRSAGGFRDVLRQVRQSLDALDIEAVHLVGHSLGGGLALALADTRPRSIARLTLIAPAGLGPQINGEMIAGIARAARAESLEPWLKQLVADPAMITPNYVQAAWQQRNAPGLRQAQMLLADALFPDGTQAFDLVAALQRIRMPARIIWGREDRVIPWQHALAAPGHVSLNLFEQIGHLPHIEKPEQVAALIAAP